MAKVLFALAGLAVVCLGLVGASEPTVRGGIHRPRSSLNSTQACTNCNDTCCNDFSESCCPDKELGGVCCLKESTFCCARSPDNRHPSRCCPRWMVCCLDGHFGCCDPGSGLPSESLKDTAFSLFVTARFTGRVPMKGFTINTLTGHKEEKTVTGFKDWGESTRRFTWDPKRAKFHLPQANFTRTPTKQAPLEFVHLYSTDPQTGVTTHNLLPNVLGLVTGFVYNEQNDVVIVACYDYNAKMEKVGYKFFHADPDTGATTLVSTSKFPASGDDWQGWFRDSSRDGTLLYRLGFENVVQQTGQGIGVTAINSATTTTTWYKNETAPAGHKWYISAAPFNGGFISLAQSSEGFGELSVFVWSIGSKPKLITKLGNAYKPQIWGPVTEYYRASDMKYVTLVIDKGDFGDENQWKLCEVQFPAGTLTEHILEPRMIAELDSTSGLGLPRLS